MIAAVVLSHFESTKVWLVICLGLVVLGGASWLVGEGKGALGAAGAAAVIVVAIASWEAVEYLVDRRR